MALAVSDLYRRYEAQTDEGKLLVELLAFYDSKITKGPLTTAYNELTRKARLGRVNVKQLLSVLEDQGLVRLTFHGFYSCAPSIVEDVAASAKTRRSAKAVVQVCHGMPSLGKSPWAVERRYWHAGSSQVDMRALGSPQVLEHFSLGITVPETLEAFPEEIALQLVGRILARGLNQVADPEPFLEWLRPKVDQTTCPVLARETYAYLCLLRDQSERVEALRAGHPEMLAFAMRDILDGKTGRAVDTISSLIRRSGTQARFPFASQELLYLAACLKEGRGELWQERLLLCPSEVAKGIRWVWQRQNRTASADHPPVEQDAAEARLAACLCSYWGGSTLATDGLGRLIAHFEAGGHTLLAGELTTLRELRGEETSRPGPILSLLPPVSVWETMLERLERWSETSQTAEQRIVWMVELRDGLPCDLTPRLQRRTKSGWTAGARLKDPRNPWADERDQLVFQADGAARNVYGVYHQGAKAGVRKAIAALVDHPRVFNSARPDQQLTFSKLAPRLLATPAGDGLRLKLDMDGEGEGEVAFKALTESHFGVIDLNSRLRELRDLLGANGLAVPAAGLPRAQQALSRMLGHELELGGELPLDLPGVALVEADSRLRVRLSPYHGGLRWSVRVVPDEERGEAFFPGRGPRVLAYHRAAGPRELRRDLDLESERWCRLKEAFPLLESESASADPRVCLELLEGLREQPSDEVLLEWPDGQSLRLRGKLPSGALRLRAAGRDDWFEVEGELSLDGEDKVSLAEVLVCLRADDRFLQLKDGSYVALTDQLRRRLAVLERAAEPTSSGGLRLPWMAAALMEADDVRGDTAWDGMLARMRAAGSLRVSLPDRFEAQLRGYQEEGFRWLARAAEWGVGVCLADDMGLGKTLQALALLSRRREEGPALVVAPTSVGANWLDETRRFASGLCPHLYGESDREALLKTAGPGDLVVCTYGLMVRDQALLKEVRWATVVLDEAQAIKNSATQRFKAAVSLPADFRLATTGTPVENHLDELWALFRFLNPALLGSRKRFSERFGAAVSDPIARTALSALVRPFILRRLKSQVLRELPARTEVTLRVDLSKEERLFYEGLRQDAVSRLEEAPELKLFTILVELTRLRRACCHPSLVKGGGGLESSKLHTFASLLAEIVEGGHRVLVFSQFVDHLNLAVEKARELGLSYQYLDGSTPTAQRSKRVADFQSGKGQVFFISLKAGGFGLNLTAANYVIHLDPWWNPAVEDQASDRAHRIGQLLPVTVYRLIARDTIEEKILRLHADKRELADQLLADTDQAAGMNVEEILGLLREGDEPIRRVSERSKPSALGARVLQDTALSMARPTSQATGTRVPARPNHRDRR
jgi:superfamily II DNA or RNA helicase